MWAGKTPFTPEERVKQTIFAIRGMITTNVYDMPRLLDLLGENTEQPTKENQ